MTNIQAVVQPTTAFNLPMAKRNKYYVVWKGHHPGIYNNWKDCEKEIKNFGGAQYKSFESKDEAETAYSQAPAFSMTAKSKQKESILYRNENGMMAFKEGYTTYPIFDSLAVDAACSGNPGIMEYQGVEVKSGTQIFHRKFNLGTNNIGEFLAIVHGLIYLKKHNFNNVLYSDSVNAIKWVKQKSCKTKLPRNENTEEIWRAIEGAENWLRNNTYTTEIRKWETETWGEIPADFNRK